jgi:hypothetical protein
MQKGILSGLRVIDGGTHTGPAQRRSRQILERRWKIERPQAGLHRFMADLSGLAKADVNRA